MSEATSLPGVTTVTREQTAVSGGRVEGLILDRTPAQGVCSVEETLAGWSEVSPANVGNLGGRDVFKQETPNDEWADGGGFFGSPRIANVKQYLAFYRAGWPGGLKELESHLQEQRLPHADRTYRRRRTYRDDGDELDVRRALDAGNCDRAYVNVRRDRGSTGVSGINIACNVSSSSGVNPQKMIWRALCAVGLVRALDTAGIPVRVIAYWQTAGLYEGKVEHGFSSLVLKDYDEPLNLHNIAIGCGHPATLRVAFFASAYSAPFRAGWGLGFPVPGAPIIRDDSAVIVVDECLSREKALAMLEVYTQEIEAGNVHADNPLHPSQAEISARISRVQNGDFS